MGLTGIAAILLWTFKKRKKQPDGATETSTDPDTNKESTSA
jgi:hypothetical protein